MDRNVRSDLEDGVVLAGGLFPSRLARQDTLNSEDQVLVTVANGGARATFMTHRATLCGSAYFAAMLTGNWAFGRSHFSLSGVIEPQHFPAVLEYLSAEPIASAISHAVLCR